MRERIRERLTEYRAEALHTIAIAVSKTSSTAAGSGNLDSSRLNLVINDDTKVGFAEYMDRSIGFIWHVAAGSWTEYADELRAAATKLKEEIMADTKSKFRDQLSEAWTNSLNARSKILSLATSRGKI